LKAWIGLSIPADGRWREKHQQERRPSLTLDYACHGITFTAILNRLNGDWTGYATKNL